MAAPDDRGRLDYPTLVQFALRDVVRRVFLEVAEHGLAPPHQLYVTFATRDPGVVVPGFLREAYPDTLTIVLEHQFWDLEVDDHEFSVTLRFGGIPHRIVVPFAALKSFVDPGVEFGLSFEGPTLANEEAEAEAPETGAPAPAQPSGAGAVVELEAFRKRRPATD
jgi:hypothetical protein